jgi:Fe2+ or Zn2+ uptake regulation protein
MSPDRELAVLALALCRYWRRNPWACDTARGIAQWWLPAGDRATVAQVEAALRSMQERGLVERVVSGDGTEHFRLREEVVAHPQLLDAESGDFPKNIQ